MDIEDKIRNKSAIIGIVGLGYVGLPLALAFAEAGFKVIGFDNQNKKVDWVNQAHSYISYLSTERLQAAVKNNLEATAEQSRLKETDAVCICLPTPLTRTKDPDLSFIIEESRELAKYLHPEHLVVLESTSYPGTTREVMMPLLDASGLKAGSDYYLAFSPERVDPGNKQFNIKNTPKLVGGIDAQSSRLAEILYRQIVDVVVPVSSPEVAEMTKVFENVFRNVNIGLVNELAQLCERMGISVWEVIASAATKPFGYMPFYPGPGVGGHCIPLDPYYLSNKALEFNFHTRFIELAAEINENMPHHVVSRVIEALNSRERGLAGARILVLGITYKKDIEDTRESPSLKLIELLEAEGAIVSYNDPYIPMIKTDHGELASLELTNENLSSADCVVLATPHTCYKIDELISQAQIVFDTRGVTRGLNGNNIVRLGEEIDGHLSVQIPGLVPETDTGHSTPKARG